MPGAEDGKALKPATGFVESRRNGQTLVTEALHALAPLNLRFSVHQTPKLTLLAQDGPDDHRLWDEVERIDAVTEKLAREFKVGALRFAGYGGSSTETFVAAWDEHGAFLWEKNDARAVKALKEATGLREAPFVPGAKPYLEVSAPWREVGSIEVFEKPDFVPATSEQLAKVFGRKMKLAGATFSTRRARQLTLQLVSFELAGTTTLASLGLTERPSGMVMAWPPPALSEPWDPVSLPDGTRRVKSTTLDGLPSTRKGATASVRWAHLFPPNDAQRTTWVQAGFAEGPFAGEVRKLEEDLEDRRREELRDAAEGDAEAALRKRDATKLARIVKKGGLSASSWALRAVKDPACFSAMLKLVPKAERQSTLDDLHDRLPLRKALALGADINARSNLTGETLAFEAESAAAVKALVAAGIDLRIADHDGRTALHATDDGAIARALVEAGAPLTVKNGDGETPVQRFTSRLSYATPTDAELAAVVAMAKHGGKGALKTINAEISSWEKKPSHKAALAKLRAKLG